MGEGGRWGRQGRCEEVNGWLLVNFPWFDRPSPAICACFRGGGGEFGGGFRMEVDRDLIMKCLPPMLEHLGLMESCGNSFKDFNQGRKMMCFVFWKIIQTAV